MNRILSFLLKRVLFINTIRTGSLRHPTLLQSHQWQDTDDDASTGAQRDPRPGLRRVAAGGAGTVDHETDAHEAGATDIRKVVLLL